MAVDQNFNVTNGIFVQNNSTINGNLILSNTSSIIVNTVTVNSSSIFSVNVISVHSSVNAIYFGSGLTLTTSPQLLFTANVVSPSNSSFRYIVDWGVQITFPVASTYKTITSLIQDNLGNQFGWRTSLVYSPSSVTQNGIAGTSMSPLYSNNSVNSFAFWLSLNIATTGNTFVPPPTGNGVADTWYNSYIIAYLISANN